jgi:hypothetical protein
MKNDIHIAKKKKEVAQLEVAKAIQKERDEQEAERERAKVKQRDEVKKRQEDRRKATLGNLREQIRGVLYGDTPPPENTGKTENLNTVFDDKTEKPDMGG